MPELTAERLRELLHYEPETGIFLWKKVTGRKAVIGMEPGWIDKDGYRLVSLDGARYRAHRLAWLYVHGVMPCFDIDHINGQRADNRIANLRDVSRVVNMQNLKKARSDSSSGYLGVERHKASGLWLARIKVGGIRKSLGYHKTPEAAHAAYLDAKRKLHEGCTI